MAVADVHGRGRVDSQHDLSDEVPIWEVSGGEHDVPAAPQRYFCPVGFQNPAIILAHDWLPLDARFRHLGNCECHRRHPDTARLHHAGAGPGQRHPELLLVVHYKLVDARLVLRVVLHSFVRNRVMRPEFRQLGYVERIIELLKRHLEDSVVLVVVGNQSLVIITVPRVVQLHNLPVGCVDERPEQRVCVILCKAISPRIPSLGRC
mmetsp:Transcript_80554/g.228212  ORF Transcript_80554/g.228212 Transcript_80554/m.228212 type:complete len:206 (-) Transcript_80554:1062-1679(-)